MTSRSPEHDAGDGGEVAFGDLARALGEDPPPSFRRADPQAVAALAAAVQRVVDHQEAHLSAATERAYDHVPRLLRGPVRRIMGGG